MSQWPLRIDVLSDASKAAFTALRNCLEDDRESASDSLGGLEPDDEIVEALDKWIEAVEDIMP